MVLSQSSTKIDCGPDLGNVLMNGTWTLSSKSQKWIKLRKSRRCQRRPEEGEDLTGPKPGSQGPGIVCWRMSQPHTWTLRTCRTSLARSKSTKPLPGGWWRPLPFSELICPPHFLHPLLPTTALPNTVNAPRLLFNLQPTATRPCSHSTGIAVNLASGKSSLQETSVLPTATLSGYPCSRAEMVSLPLVLGPSSLSSNSNQMN